MSQTKLLKQIKDVPHFYIENSLFEGNIEDVAKNVLNIRKQLKELYNQRDKKGYEDKFTPFEDYQYIKIRCNIYYESMEYELEVWRDETDEEFKDRKKQIKERSIAAKKAILTKAKNLEIEEKALLEKLKKKYENM